MKASLFIAPSTIMGAVRPPRRRPATSVVVFQWPCGTVARHRSPRGPRRAAEPSGGGPGLVDEDELRRVELGLEIERGLAACGYVLARLLAGVRRLLRT